MVGSRYRGLRRTDTRRGREVASRYRQGGRRLQGRGRSDAAIVGCRERTRGGREAASVFYSHLAFNAPRAAIPPTTLLIRASYRSLNNTRIFTFLLKSNIVKSSPSGSYSSDLYLSSRIIRTCHPPSVPET